LAIVSANMPESWHAAPKMRRPKAAVVPGVSWSHSSHTDDAWHMSCSRRAQELHQEDAMATGGIRLKKTESVLAEIERLHQAISQRAYDLFRDGGTWGGAVADWLNAERELIARPAIELRQKEGQYEVLAALPGIEAKDLDVQITPDDVLIKGETTHEHRADGSTVYICEFERGRAFRSIHFPEKVDPDRVKAVYRNGLLRLTAAIAKPSTAKKVDIKAA
jgi:HSP20 family molecular chaperone IbpA